MHAKHLPKKFRVPQGSKVGKITFDGGSSEWLYEEAFFLLPVSLLIIIHMSLLHSFSFGVLIIALYQLFSLLTHIHPLTPSRSLFLTIILRNSGNHIIIIQVHWFHPLLSTLNSATHLKSQTLAFITT